jgi:single-strand DNA-binding protein
MNTLNNNVKLIGRLGKNPEVRTLEKGNKFATFSLATDENHTGKDGSRQQQTQWHNIIVWGRLAEFCEKYLQKGKQVAIDGRITYRNWEDQNKVKHYLTEIVANDIMFLSPNTETK